MTANSDTSQAPLKCGNCGSEQVARKRSWLSAAVMLGIFLFSLVLGAEMAQTAGVVFGLIALVMFAVSVSALLNAAFGKNRCKECGNKWR